LCGLVDLLGGGTEVLEDEVWGEKEFGKKSKAEGVGEEFGN